MMGTKTAMLLVAVAVALLTGCASDVKQQRHSNAAIEQIKELNKIAGGDPARGIPADPILGNQAIEQWLRSKPDRSSSI